MEYFVDLLGEVARLPSELVDAYAEGCEALEVHEEVVDEVFDAAVVVASDDGAEGEAVDGSEGMVAHEGGRAPVGGQVVEAFDAEGDTEFVDDAFAEVDAFAIFSKV